MSSPDQARGGEGARPLDPDKLLRAAMAGGDAAAAAAGGWQPPPVEELGQHFPELEIVELIGRGGMGAVYRAVQVRLGRTVALKILPRELAADPAFEERFLREARALAGLQHPRILTVHDFGEHGGFYYLVTEFVEGMNLRQLMDMGELSPTEALRIAPQVCEALQYAHDHGVVHRDIKPENLLIDTKGEVKVADFGLARILGEAAGAPALTRSTQVLGTPQYMAPEQWRHGTPVDHRADIYAVGVVLYEMLTGQLPLGHFDPPSRRKGVPMGLDAVVRRSLAQQPDERYQHASEVGDDVRRQQVDTRGSCGGRARRQARHAVGDGTVVRGGVPWMLKASWLLAVLMLVGAFVFNRVINEAAYHFYIARSEQARLMVEARSWADGKGLQLEETTLLDRYVGQVLVPAWEARRSEAIQAGQDLAEARPEVPVVPEIGSPGSVVWVWFSAAIALATLLFMLSGFAALRRIRARRAGTAGLGLALFTAWSVPIAVVIAVAVSVLHINMRDGDMAVFASTIVGVVLGLAGIVWMGWQYHRLAGELSSQP